MYDAVADPYCYSGTTVLKNFPGIRDQADISETMIELNASLMP
jgi:cell filamentation protein